MLFIFLRCQDKKFDWLEVKQSCLLGKNEKNLHKQMVNKVQ